MTPRRAFWEALATVCIPNLLIWAVLIYFLSPHAISDEWPLYLIFFALPLPLFFPIYNRYRTGVKYGGNRKPWQHLAWAIVSAILSAGFLADALHRKGWDLIFHLLIAILWLGASANNFRRWTKASANIPVDTINAQN